MTTEKIDLVVIGAGVVGSAVAQALAGPKCSVWVLEAGPRIAEGTTSRNSGVIHSGLYYVPTSLKAKTCVRGNRLLYEWCAKKNVPHQKIGKLVVAVSHEDEAELNQLYANARSSGAEGLKLLSQDELRALEPDIQGIAALQCPETGIVDPVELTKSLLLDAEQNGASVITDSEVRAIERDARGFTLQTTRGSIEAGKIVNAAGLYSDDVARMAGIDKYRIYPCRGDYFTFRTKTTYRRLLYPAKRSADHGLGIHLTIDLAGNYRFGPDSEYVTSKNDFSPAEGKLEKFRKSCERLFGPIDPSQLAYDSCGIRPKLRAPNEKVERDFVIAKDYPGFINLVGIDSPGLTGSLAIAEIVKKML